MLGLKLNHVSKRGHRWQAIIWTIAEQVTDAYMRYWRGELNSICNYQLLGQDQRMQLEILVKIAPPVGHL